MRALLLAVLAALAFAANAAEPATVTLDVPGMTCPLCPLTVRKALEQLPGVSSVSVDYEGRTALVIYDPDRVRPGALTEAITNAGYPSTVRE